MDRELIARDLRAERLDLADFLEELTPEEWSRDSLCADWSVREVAAHLTTADTLGATLAGLVRARGDWDRMNADAAVARAARHTPRELVAQLRAFAESPRRSPGAAPIDPLADIIVHGQDIARPLGRTRTAPTDQVLACLDHIVASRFYGARKRLRGLRLTATDADWTYGTGPERVEAPALDLLLLATGRRL
ncbi:maleylpyruvate isomerase family mycothiol-dependent enzyme [Nocardia sp. NPDC004415]